MTRVEALRMIMEANNTSHATISAELFRMLNLGTAEHCEDYKAKLNKGVKQELQDCHVWVDIESHGLYFVLQDENGNDIESSSMADHDFGIEKLLQFKNIIEFDQDNDRIVIDLNKLKKEKTNDTEQQNNR